MKQIFYLPALLSSFREEIMTASLLTSRFNLTLHYISPFHVKLRYQ